MTLEEALIEALKGAKISHKDHPAPFIVWNGRAFAYSYGKHEYEQKTASLKPNDWYIYEESEEVS